VSTDGDSDRPLLVGVDAAGQAQFFGGDTLGIIVADYLGTDAIAVPVTATDAVDLHFADRVKGGAIVLRRTRVGSPWVIAAMSGLPGVRRVGWEANGGFLTFSEIERDGRRLAALPTRDAALPLIAALHAAKGGDGGLGPLFAGLPRRFSRSALIDGVPAAASRALAARFGAGEPDLAAAIFPGGGDAIVLNADGSACPAAPATTARLREIRDDLARTFGAGLGFAGIARLDFLDGTRVTFDDGEIAHLRPSGNAPQLRIYAVASTEERADAIIDLAVREPDGFLHALVREVEGRPAG
jgi:phosphomannomutase